MKIRSTKARSKILDIFSKSSVPIDALELLKKVKVNKTTIYRELDFLLKNGFLNEVNFADGKKRYETKNSDHHHHLVCLNCEKVSDVEVEENFVIPKNFKLIKHNLEFFGYCFNCK